MLPWLVASYEGGFMGSVAALPANPSLQSAEDRLRERLKETRRTALSSEYVAFHASRDEVIALAKSDNLSELRPAYVIGFIRLRSGKLLYHYEVINAVRNLLEDKNGGMMIREEAEEYELAS